MTIPTTSTQATPRRLLVTGASGFIGSFIVARGLELGFEVWAAMRTSSSKRYLTDDRIRFITLDLSDETKLTGQLTAHVAEHGAWHAVVHAAGATKCRRDDDFFEINTRGTERLARALMTTGALTGRLVFVSSLSVCGPLHEKDYAPITALDTPQPNTAYGRSKLQAEAALSGIADLDYVALRPTGVYGPRERDYFMMAKSIKSHVDFAVGYRRQIITFIYVADLVEAIFLALDKGQRGKAYALTDGGEYASRAFSDLLQQHLGVKQVLHIKAPLWVLKMVCGIAGTWAKWRGKTATLNGDKYKIMKQRNWRADISDAQKDLGYAPQYPLERGVAESVAWYKSQKWL